MASVTIFVDRQKIGEGLLKNGKIVGFRGMFPSMDPTHTDDLLDLVEEKLSRKQFQPDTLHGKEVSWSTREQPTND